MDDLTKGAIKAFKVANKLPADHIPGPQVLKLLGL
jgi:peptidoglycan hydrolase-like protein with peptidoglycan-binding domain